jgi:hypothetical protein
VLAVNAYDDALKTAKAQGYEQGHKDGYEKYSQETLEEAYVDSKFDLQAAQVKIKHLERVAIKCH